MIASKTLASTIAALLLSAAVAAAAAPDARDVSQMPERLVLSKPVAQQLAQGLVVIPYHAEYLRFAPVFGPVTPVGLVRVTVDGATSEWMDASDEPLVIAGLAVGNHKVQVGLADATRQIVDSKSIRLTVPPSTSIQ